MRTRLWRGTLTGALLLFVVLMVARPLPAPVGQTVSYVVQSATVLTACVAMAARARGARGPLRRARGLISASLLAAAAGGVLALAVRLGADGDPPLPSVADAVHFLFLPLCVAGLLSYPVSKETPGSRAQMVLDGVVAATALWFVTYTALLAPAQVTSDLPVPAALTILGYPAADVFVIAMAAGALHRVAPVARRELTLSAAGVSLYAVSDIAYTVLSARGAYTADSWVAALAELGLVLLVVAVRPTSGPAGAAAAPWTRWPGLIPQLSVAAALVSALVLSGFRGGLTTVELALLVTVMVALLLRQLVGNRDRDDAVRHLREKQALFRSLVVGSSDLITLHRSDGTLAYTSPAVSRLTGISADALLRTRPHELVHPDDMASVRELRRRLGAPSGAVTELLLRVRAGDGSWRWCQVLAHNLLDDPDVRGIVCNTRDVHERHLLEQRLHHEASHDALTGLGNLLHARRLLDTVCRQGADAVVALVDLDGFKRVNDTFGHADGDALLTVVADRLRRCARSEDAVTRIGGDEFLLLLHGEDAGGRLAGRVLEALAHPVVVNGRSLTVGASIGLVAVEPGATPDELLRNADLAMYAAKAAGRNRAHWFEPRMHEAARRTMTITTELRQALQDGGLEVHYQPVLQLATGELAFVEALVRWRDAAGQLVSPCAFIPVAEEVGLMREIDAWVLDQACADLAAWRRAGYDIPQVSVNISRTHLTPDLARLVQETLTRHGLRGPQLCLEVTETSVAPDPEATTAVLRAVRDLEVQIALDDFGTGQSSLSELAALPIDLVKVDRSFLVGAERADAVALLTSIISLCRALGLPVVAEGIEDAEVGRQLVASGCTYGQGYALGRPQPPAELLASRARTVVPAPRAPVADGTATSASATTTVAADPGDRG